MKRPTLILCALAILCICGCTKDTPRSLRNTSWVCENRVGIAVLTFTSNQDAEFEYTLEGYANTEPYTYYYKNGEGVLMSENEFDPYGGTRFFVIDDQLAFGNQIYKKQ